jgi:hypothetical protein
MSLISLVAGCQQKLDFFPLLHRLWWERSWVQTRGSVSRRVVDCVRSLSSRGQWIYSNLLMITRKVAIRGLHEIHMADDHTRNECGKSVTY